MKYSHLVFDIDGTLLDTEKASLYSLRDVVFDMLQLDMSIRDLRFSLGITSDDALHTLGIADVTYGNSLWQVFYQKYAGHVRIFDGIPEILRHLSRQTNTLGIITSKTKAEYQNDFVPFGLAQYFSIVVCASDTRKHKPDSEPMVKFLEWSKADSGSVLYIGDTIHDMNCAKGANADFALALWGCENPKEIRADHYLSSPYDIAGLLQSSK
ncbi:MAG: HAD family hydrolase [Clostridia bacterium]|nr:HAD family hydrolase [Clostridia bacterium]